VDDPRELPCFTLRPWPVDVTRQIDRVPPKKESKDRPKLTEEETGATVAAQKLEKAVLDAKIKFMEEVGKKADVEEVAAAEKLADELLAEDPKLLKVLLWRLSTAESKLKDAVSPPPPSPILTISLVRSCLEKKSCNPEF
jgi:hypothetical protein